MHDFVGALDQGTSSTRFIVFDHDGNEVARHQLEHRQILPRPGWVEHDPMEILDRAGTAMGAALANAGLRTTDLAALGITNQRETTVVWDRKTGLPYTNAIVWQDTRTDRIAAELAGGSGGELVRRQDRPPAGDVLLGGKTPVDPREFGHRPSGRAGRDALFGTIDSWLLWNLTGGTKGGQHVTDVTNASRTMLMDLRTLTWDDQLLALFGVPREMLPEIRPSSGHYGEVAIDGAGGGRVRPDRRPRATSTRPWWARSACALEKRKTHTGRATSCSSTPAPRSQRRKVGCSARFVTSSRGRRPVYALEGSIAVTGAAVQWLRDQLGIIEEAAEIEKLASTVEDSGGVYFVPAFSGLFAPYWRSDARGAVVGLTRASTKAHLARATLEAICYQTRDVLLAMELDLGTHLEELKVDGGITSNRLCMQLQADILGLPVSKPAVPETTALGAAYAAGCAVGYWAGEDDLRRNWREADRWEPRWDEDRRQTGYAAWKKAVDRALDWAGPGSTGPVPIETRATK